MTVDVTRGDGVLRLVLDRPARRNAVSTEMIATLVAALEAAAVDDELRVIALTGAGPDFCSGVDWVATNDAGRRPRAGHLTRRTPLGAHRVIQLLHDVQLPVVCAVRGWAVGFGLGLALAADFTVAASDATFWAPFARRGFTPDSGSTWVLPRLVGVARAKELLLLGRQIDGARAESLGLIHRAVDGHALDTAVAGLVAELAAGPTVALGLAKAAIHASLEGPLDRAMAGEVRALELAARTSDFKEGLSAFRERREPTFEGR